MEEPKRDVIENVWASVRSIGQTEYQANSTKNSMDPSQNRQGDLYVFIGIGCWRHTGVRVFNPHELSNRSVADSVCSCRDAGLAAVAAAAAVETGHVHPVQVIMILSASRSHRLLFTVLIRPVCTNTHNRHSTVSWNRITIFIQSALLQGQIHQLKLAWAQWWYFIDFRGHQL